jgi:hypothetical protein
MSRALELALETCLGYVAFSVLCVGLWIDYVELCRAASPSRTRAFLGSGACGRNGVTLLMVARCRSRALARSSSGIASCRSTATRRNSSRVSSACS